MSKSVRIIVGVTVLVLLATAVLWCGARNRRTLQHYVAELQARGEKLSFEELSASHTNRFQDTLSHLAQRSISLGTQPLNPSKLELRKPVSPGRARAAWKTEAPWHPDATGNGKGDWPEFTAQIDAMAGPLAELREALKDPDADLGPRTTALAPVQPNFVALRTVAHWLAGATVAELRREQLEPAVDNLEALAGLVRLHRDEYTLVSQMIRVAICGLGSSAVWESLQASGWTEAQLARLQTAWESADLLQGIETAFAGERAMGRECWAGVRKGGGRALRQSPGFTSPNPFAGLLADGVLIPAYRLTSIDADERWFLECMQEALTAIRALRTGRSWVDVRRPLDERVKRCQTAPAPERLQHWLSQLALPNLSKALQTGVRRETERRMAVVAIALKRYELRHGKPAPDLSALAPAFLTAIPIDPMSGRPLRYTLSPSTSWQLYSVGENGLDDGGDPKTNNAQELDLWNGLDAVWPALE